jgi:hypothetical protein
LNAPVRRTVTRSASSAGLVAIHRLRLARLRIPCSSTRIFWIVRRDSSASASIRSRNTSTRSVSIVCSSVVADLGEHVARTVLR